MPCSELPRTKRLPPRVALISRLVVVVAVVTATAEGSVVSDGPLATIKRSLHAAQIEFDERHVEAVEGSGLYEVALDAGTYIYLTPDGRHIVAGDLFEVRGDRIVAITDSTRRAKRRATMAQIAQETTITFAPNSGAGTPVVVFTDTDCQYCRDLHSQVSQYLARSIEIRYMAYPTGGPGSATYRDMVSAWCANDRQSALSDLIRGEQIEPLSCDNPVARHYEIGEQMGVTGTPTIVLPDGRAILGMFSADQLAEALGL